MGSFILKRKMYVAPLVAAVPAVMNAVRLASAAGKVARVANVASKAAKVANTVGKAANVANKVNNVANNVGQIANTVNNVRQASQQVQQAIQPQQPAQPQQPTQPQQPMMQQQRSYSFFNPLTTTLSAGGAALGKVAGAVGNVTGQVVGAATGAVNNISDSFNNGLNKGAVSGVQDANKMNEKANPQDNNNNNQQQNNNQQPQQNNNQQQPQQNNMSAYCEDGRQRLFSIERVKQAPNQGFLRNMGGLVKDLGGVIWNRRDGFKDALVSTAVGAGAMIGGSYLADKAIQMYLKAKGEPVYGTKAWRKQQGISDPEPSSRPSRGGIFAKRPKRDKDNLGYEGYMDDRYYSMSDIWGAVKNGFNKHKGGIISGALMGAASVAVPFIGQRLLQGAQTRQSEEDYDDYEEMPRRGRGKMIGSRGGYSDNYRYYSDTEEGGQPGGGIFKGIYNWVKGGIQDKINAAKDIKYTAGKKNRFLRAAAAYANKKGGAGLGTIKGVAEDLRDGSYYSQKLGKFVQGHPTLALLGGAALAAGAFKAAGSLGTKLISKPVRKFDPDAFAYQMNGQYNPQEEEDYYN